MADRLSPNVSTITPTSRPYRNKHGRALVDRTCHHGRAFVDQRVAVTGK